jgi:hypothetical protein
MSGFFFLVPGPHCGEHKRIGLFPWHFYLEGGAGSCQGQAEVQGVKQEDESPLPDVSLPIYLFPDNMIYKIQLITLLGVEYGGISAD